MRESSTVPTSNNVLCVSGRASFLNLRTIMSKIVLKEKFKQNKMGTMAGNHSEILSEEPECWPEAVVQSLNDCETHQTSRDWQHIPLPPARELSSSSQMVPIWITFVFLGKEAQKSSSQQVSAPRTH